MREQNQGSDVEACLPFEFSAGFARAFDHDDGFQAGPVVTLT
jgi:hypothetical protein